MRVSINRLSKALLSSHHVVFVGQSEEEGGEMVPSVKDSLEYPTQPCWPGP